MRKPAVAIALVAAFVLAGCLGAVEDAPGDVASNGSEGPRLGLDSPLPVEPAAGTDLSAPPQWAVGEWWEIEAEFTGYGGSATITRVVAGTDGGSYLVGMSKDSFNDRALVLHFPGFGRVNASTLGFDAHDRPMNLLQFPLAEGATWETQWYSGAPLPAEVVEVDGDTAHVVLDNDGTHMEVTYDASVRVITELVVDGYMRYEVVDHGLAFPGTVEVPYKHDLVFCHGRIAVAQAIEPCALELAPNPKPPTETVTLDDTYDRASFGLLMSDLQDTGAAGTGYYRVEATTPDGTTYAAEKLPDTPGVRLVTDGHAPAAGDWEVTTVATGAGFSLFEGVAYEVLEITAPAGDGV